MRSFPTKFFPPKIVLRVEAGGGLVVVRGKLVGVGINAEEMLCGEVGTSDRGRCGGEFGGGQIRGGLIEYADPLAGRDHRPMDHSQTHPGGRNKRCWTLYDLIFNQSSALITFTFCVLQPTKYFHHILTACTTDITNIRSQKKHN